MPNSIDATVEAVATAADWNARIALIRQVPEHFGTAMHQDVYAAIASRVYVPNLAPDFGYIHWREEYALPVFQGAYERAHHQTDGFRVVDVDTLHQTLRDHPDTLRVFRLLLGLTTQEFAASTEVVAEALGVKAVGNSRVKHLEAGKQSSSKVALCCAHVIDRAMHGTLFAVPPTADLQPKLQKPDTVDSWETVRKYAREGVPHAVFLHQRHYGGAFRQLLDATSTQRGNIIEDAVETVFRESGVPYIRTGAHDQEEIARRFGLTVKPAPDFVLFNGGDTLRALLECKGSNDGGTARDKAARFRTLHSEAGRLGGIPLFAVLAGLGWKRTADALGPVVRDTDGRVFTLPTLSEMLTVQPFPMLVGTVSTRHDQK